MPPFPPEPESIAAWEEVPGLLAGTSWLLTVKSLDQRERRRSMVERRASGKIGRVAHREPAQGLVVSGRLYGGHYEGLGAAFTVSGRTGLREPRHAVEHNGGWLVTANDQLLQLDWTLKVREVFTHPWFSFLHTVEMRGNTALVASAGLDQIVCLALNGSTGTEVWRWSAWDHGLNVTPSGETLAEVHAHHDHCGCGTAIDPAKLGPLGLVTSGRAAHIAAAAWDDEGGFYFLASRLGGLFHVADPANPEDARLITDDLGELPHGLRRLYDGWTVTCTPQGAWWLLGPDFKRRQGWSVVGLPGKDADAGEAEWVQQAIPYDSAHWLLIDANRGLIVVDVVRRLWSRYAVDPDWCVQDAVLIR